MLKIMLKKNSVLPSTVSIGSTSYSMNDFLYLLFKAIVNRNSGSSSAVTVLATSAPSSPSGNNKLGKIYKADFVSIAKNLVNYYTTNKKAPNYVSSNLGNLQYPSTIYVFSRIGAIHPQQ